MRILLYVDNFLPNIGGKEIVVYHIANQLSKLGHHVRVVGPGGMLTHRKLKFAFPVHRCPMLKGFFDDQINWIYLFLNILFFKCDVIHAHITNPNGYIAAKIKNLFNFPLVITPHGEDIHIIPEIGFGQRLDPVKRKKIEFALKSAEIVTAISDSVEFSLIDAGCDTNKIRKIPNGIDIERFQLCQNQNIRRWLEFDEDTRLILTVGNYHQRKGHEYIIKAMPMILSEIPNARLVIVGAKQDVLKEMIRSSNLDEYVRLTGSIPFPFSKIQNKNKHLDDSQDRLAALYCQSDVYVSASINQEAEGLSLSMLDAMAAGLPVVATQISGNSEIVINGKTGFLVPPTDHKKLSESITTVLKDNNQRIEMGKQGSLIAQKYHWREISNQYLEIYREAIEKATYKTITVAQ